jgi:LPS-assembly lipoprotein
MKTSSFLLLLAATLVLAACGFHLRGHAGSVKLAFQSVYLKVTKETPFVADLRSGLMANKVTINDSAENATITLEVSSEATDKQILSLSSAGKVLEYQLRFRVTLRAYDKLLAVWLPEEEILLMRTLAYDDTRVLAKEQEEALLYKDMRSDAVQQVLRRLSRAKPHNENGDIINLESAASGVPPDAAVKSASGVSEAGTVKSAK